MNIDKTPEKHPLEPFLPDGAKVLMLGSFPPPRARWSMDFYYPNIQNDMWRIMGLVFYDNKNEFLMPDGKRFDEKRLKEFCSEKGIAISDTACEVVRLKDNASDQFLRVTKSRDLAEMLRRIPMCKAVITTGQKATDTLLAVTGGSQPAVGESSEFEYMGRRMTLWRMPSSSRAYPKPIEEKAAVYRKMFLSLGVL